METATITTAKKRREKKLLNCLSATGFRQNRNNWTRDKKNGIEPNRREGETPTTTHRTKQNNNTLGLLRIVHEFSRGRKNRIDFYFILTRAPPKWMDWLPPKTQSPFALRMTIYLVVDVFFSSLFGSFRWLCLAGQSIELTWLCVRMTRWASWSVRMICSRSDENETIHIRIGRRNCDKHRFHTNPFLVKRQCWPSTAGAHRTSNVDALVDSVSLPMCSGVSYLFAWFIIHHLCICTDSEQQILIIPIRTANEHNAVSLSLFSLSPKSNTWNVQFPISMSIVAHTVTDRALIQPITVLHFPGQFRILLLVNEQLDRLNASLMTAMQICLHSN